MFKKNLITLKIQHRNYPEWYTVILRCIHKMFKKNLITLKTQHRNYPEWHTVILRLLWRKS